MVRSTIAAKPSVKYHIAEINVLCREALQQATGVCPVSKGQDFKKGVQYEEHHGLADNASVRDIDIE